MRKIKETVDCIVKAKNIQLDFWNGINNLGKRLVVEHQKQVFTKIVINNFAKLFINSSLIYLKIFFF